MSTEPNIVLFKTSIEDETLNVDMATRRGPANAYGDLPEAFRTGADSFYGDFLTREQTVERLNKMKITQRTLDVLGL